MTIQEKLQAKINDLAGEVEKYSTTRFSVCDHYNWDRDFWAHKSAMVEALAGRGYTVSKEIKWGVIDYTITKPVQVS